MAIKFGGYDGGPEIFERLWCSNWNNDHVQMDFDHAIDFNDNGGYDGKFSEEMEVSFEKAPANLKDNLESRLQKI